MPTGWTFHNGLSRLATPACLLLWGLFKVQLLLLSAMPQMAVQLMGCLSSPRKVVLTLRLISSTKMLSVRIHFKRYSYYISSSEGSASKAWSNASSSLSINLPSDFAISNFSSCSFCLVRDKTYGLSNRKS